MTHPNTEQPPDGLLTCPFCYKWLGDHHRKEDCPRSQPADTSLDDLKEKLSIKLEEILGQNYIDEYSGSSENIMVTEIAAQLLPVFQSQTTALLKRVREEVIGEDDTYGKLKGDCIDRNLLRAEQRKALDSLEKEMMG